MKYKDGFDVRRVRRRQRNTAVEVIRKQPINTAAHRDVRTFDERTVEDNRSNRFDAEILFPGFEDVVRLFD